MKVRSVDIARALGISKATVSLALNNKPGVNSETREKVLECKEKLEKGIKYTAQKDQMIKVVVIIRNLKIALDPEINLWNDVWATYDQEVKKLGYSLSVTYFDVTRDSSDILITECNSGLIAGVIFHATEMYWEDWKFFKGLRVPFVVYDNDFPQINAHCVITDDYTESGQVISYLLSQGCKNIVYLANSKVIYNFKQRRKGYIEALREIGEEKPEKSMVVLGSSVDEICRTCKLYLEREKLPDAFVTENYQISIGVTRALQEFNIRIPEDVSLIGFDVIPSYLTGYMPITTVRIEHSRRAAAAVGLLQKEIEDRDEKDTGDKIYFKVITKCKIVEGESVRSKL